MILNKLGLHARAAAKVVSIANEFESTIIITKDGKNADARSIMKLLMLSASQGSRISIEVDGTDQKDAMKSIEKLFNNKFDEIILVGSGKGVVQVQYIKEIGWKRKKSSTYKKLSFIYKKEIKIF